MRTPIIFNNEIGKGTYITSQITTNALNLFSNPYKKIPLEKMLINLQTIFIEEDIVN